MAFTIVELIKVHVKGEIMKKVVVVGSINMDLVSVCKKAPKGGETLFGSEFFQAPGGKGANQAVAIGKLGTDVVMLGKVGKDSFGKEMLKELAYSGVEIDYIGKEEGATGIANIVLEESGQNRIIVIPGANGLVDKKYIDENIEVIRDCDVVVAQLEVPIQTVEYVFAKAKELGKKTILNPAPAAKLSRELIKNSDYIVPNESELGVLTGIDTESDEGIEKAGKKLIEMGVGNLIVTLGSKGSLYMSRDKKEYYPAYVVKAVDTTAAGDSFIGGFVRALDLEKNSVGEAIEFATKVSAIAVTRRGAQPSIPTLEEVLNFKGVKR